MQRSLRFVTIMFAIALTVGAVMPMQAQVADTVTIPQIQMVPVDSLLIMDVQQSAAAGRLDDSPYNNDTVVVTGVVIVKPRILTYTLARYNIFIQDTATGQVWGGLNVLTNDTSDQAQSTLITALDSGDVVTVKGRITEFGSQPNGLSEIFIYNVGFYESVTPVSVGASGPRPLPVELTVDSFAVGTTPMPSRGEKYEGMYVVIRNVTVSSVDLSSGRFTFQDASGNQMTMYDGSGYYTIRGHKIAGSRYTAPPVGTKLSYIRGVILPQARTGTAGEYNIMPLYPGPGQLSGSTYPGDVVIDKFAPSITLLRRTPGVPVSADQVNLTWKASDLNNASGPVDSCALYYKVGTGGSWVRVTTLLAPGDSLFRATIPPQADGSLVSYYVTAYAPGNSTGSFPDPTAPKFYVVRNAGLTIYDLQYTPYVNGLSGFSDDTVTVSGIVTADTSDLKVTSSSRPRLWMSDGAGEWKGIAIFGNSASTGIDTLVRGDNIRVRGVVFENFSRTELRVLSIEQVIGRNASVPAATTVSISGVGSFSYSLSNPPVDGTAAFEKWEGVLVNFAGPYLVARNADNLTGGSGSNFGEFFVGSSKTTSFGVRVDDAGTNRYYADTSASYTAKPSDAILIPVAARIATLTGIADWSFSFYKLLPRKDDDFGAITGVEKVDEVPTDFSLSQNYPNPFNPSTTINYQLPVNNHVSLKVYDMIGSEVAVLVNNNQEAGSYAVQFNAASLSSGVYFYRLESGSSVSTKKFILMK